MTEVYTKIDQREVLTSYIDRIEEQLNELRQHRTNPIAVQNLIDNFIGNLAPEHQEEWNESIHNLNIKFVSFDRYQELLVIFIRKIKLGLQSGRLRPEQITNTPKEAVEAALNSGLKQIEDTNEAQQKWQAKWQEQIKTYNDQVIYTLNQLETTTPGITILNKAPVAELIVRTAQAESKTSTQKLSFQDAQNRFQRRIQATELRQLGLPAGANPLLIEAMRMIANASGPELANTPYAQQIPQASIIAAALAPFKQQLSSLLEPMGFAVTQTKAENYLGNLAVTLTDAQTQGKFNKPQISTEEIRSLLALAAGAELSPLELAKVLPWAYDHMPIRYALIQLTGRDPFLPLPEIAGLAPDTARAAQLGPPTERYPYPTSGWNRFLGQIGDGTLKTVFSLGNLPFINQGAAAAGHVATRGGRNILSSLLGLGQGPLGLVRATTRRLAIETLIALVVVGVISFFVFNSVLASPTGSNTPITAGQTLLFEGDEELPGGPGAPEDATRTAYTGPLGPVDILGCPTNSGLKICQVPYASYSHSAVNAYDIAVPLGGPVYASHDGFVVEYCNDFAVMEKICVINANKPRCNNRMGRYGNYVKLVRKENNDPQGKIIDYTWYGHFQDVTQQVIDAYNSGALIPVGTPLGRADDNGCSSGSHLHYEHRDANNQPDHAVFLDLDKCGYILGGCRKK